MFIKLVAFEGNLDLLHQLLKKNKINIYDIDISNIADQFLALIDETDLDSKSEFILLVTELIKIKTKMILKLPEEVDSIEEMAIKLELYDAFIKIASKLKEMQRFDIFYRDTPPQVSTKILNINETTNTLLEVFVQAVKNSPPKTQPIPNITIEQEVFSIEEKIVYLENRLISSKHLSLDLILSETISLSEKIVVFLALLELIQSKKVCVTQKDNFKDIYITYE